MCRIVIVYDDTHADKKGEIVKPSIDETQE